MRTGSRKQKIGHYKIFSFFASTKLKFSFSKKSVNTKPFLVRMTFCTHQNFCKCYETSKILSTSFGGCKNSVRWENPLFLDIHQSLGHQMSQHNGFAQKPPKIVKWLSYHISMEQGLTKMVLVEMDFEQRFCRARTYPVRVKMSPMVAYSQRN